MRKFQRLLWVGIMSVLTLAQAPVHAITATPPVLATPAMLSFAEIKITGDEFLVLQNNTGSTIPDLSSYWLQDFNNVNPLAGGVSNSSQQLPQISLASGQTLLLGAVPMATCGAAVAGKLNISLTDGGGFLELVQVSQNTNGAVIQTPGDVVSWSSSTSGLIPSVPSSTKDPRAVWYRYQNVSSYAWQQADLDASNVCQLDVTLAGTTTPQGLIPSLGQSSTSPPATIISIASDTVVDSTSTGTMPAADFGLLAPQLSELLPNPDGTGTDGTDEYIELYNPNSRAFDLTGFTLQVGTTTTHSYVFPGGTIAAKSFKAFYAAETGLSMSNTGGQAVLLDPLGTVIAQTDVYGTAKDGQAWAIASGKWYWTTSPTPGGANVINQPAAVIKTKLSKKSTKTSGAVKAASTSKNSTPAGGTAPFDSSAAQVTPVHPWTLALVAAVALLYGTYEYRVDLANKIHQFRANRAARRVAG